MTTKTLTKTIPNKSNHPYVLPWVRVLEVTGVVLVFVIGLSIIAQILYPRSWSLPNTRIAGQGYGYKPRGSIEASLRTVDQRPFVLQTGSERHEYASDAVGVTVDADGTTQQVLGYNLGERLIPFSIFFEKRDEPFLAYRVDDKKARTFVESLAAHDMKPKNAMVRLKGTEVIVEKSKPGYAYNPDTAFHTLHTLKLTYAKTISLKPETVEPLITDQATIEAAQILRQRMSKPLTVVSEGQRITFDTRTIASWVTIQNDKNIYRVVYSPDQIKKSLAGLARKVYIAPVAGITRFHDGVGVGTTTSKAGRALNIAAGLKVITQAARTSSTDVSIPAQLVTPAVQTIRTYSRSSRGVQALLSYWSQSHGGQHGVVMRTLDGRIGGQINANRQFTSGSVYKVYVAYVVYTKVNAHQLSMNKKLSNGRTVAECLELMIVRSDNACGHALGDLIGWNASTGVVRAKGFSRTDLDAHSLLTTPQDAANFMRFVQSRTLTGVVYDSQLLGYFGRQIWRYAIPAGSPGMHVANKLGTIGAYNNDIAIVYHPKGAYILSVFTSGSDFGTIRGLASEIAQLMSQ